jgi:ribosomal protein S1
VKLGDEVDVVVTDVNLETGKLGLSMRQAQADPVEELGARLQSGEVVNGKVTRLKDFGAFVELADNVEGLIHISDLAHYRVRHPKDILKVGEIVRVKVLEIVLDKRQIKLSLKALAADPWDGIAERYQVGKTITGKVESVQDFGVFVTLGGAAGMGAAIVAGDDLKILMPRAAISVLVLDPRVRESDVPIVVRQLVFPSPPCNLFGLTVRPAVAVLLASVALV